MDPVPLEIILREAKVGGKYIIVNTIPLALKHPVHPPLILLNEQSSIELSYNLCVPVMLELYDLINPSSLAKSNSMIN